jgi:hypothetical protein
MTRNLPGKVDYRHVYRKSNKMADWLANIAKELTVSQDLAPLLNGHHEGISPFSEPPFSHKAISEHLKLKDGQTNM